MCLSNIAMRLHSHQTSTFLKRLWLLTNVTCTASLIILTSFEANDCHDVGGGGGGDLSC